RSCVLVCFDVWGGNKVGAAASRQWRRIGITVGLAVWIRGPGGETLVDGELGTVVGDDVVIERRRWRCVQRSRDVIGRRAGVLTSHTAVGCRNVVSRDEIRTTAGG